MIEVCGLTKRYGAKYAVRDASFAVKKGAVTGFLGRNGAGKSTTLNIITGYISPSGGKVLFDGLDLLDEPREIKRRIGYLPEQPPLYSDMTVREYLRFVCRLKEVAPRRIPSHLNDLYAMTRLQDHRKRLIRNLSKGYRQRVGLAQALVGDPDVIILDEPTVGLDPRQIIEFRGLIRDLGARHTVLLSSHILREVADVCGRVVIINEGRIVAQDALANLAGGAGAPPGPAARSRPRKGNRGAHRRAARGALGRLPRGEGAGHRGLPAGLRTRGRRPRADRGADRGSGVSAPDAQARLVARREEEIPAPRALASMALSIPNETAFWRIAVCIVILIPGLTLAAGLIVWLVRRRM